ncbi:hypothetical protein Tco_0625089 [Tanacetum coccineum]|uniref:Transposase n=1 Tax=Tanacetum coccineum TaxID=301880 RepID=A0ABQ4WFT7_9ASTR
MVIEGEVLNDFPRFVGILITEFATGGMVNLVLKMKGDMIIKNLDLKPMIDAMMRDFCNGLGLTVISDSHKGLIEAVKTWLANAEHRHCYRHIYANFKRKSMMKEIRDLDAKAYAYLMERDPSTWCKAFFQTDRHCTSFENRISESFNGKIMAARGKPIITMLEDIRVYVMQRNWNMSKQASELQDQITPSIKKRLDHLKVEQRKWQVFASGYQVVEVRRRDHAFGVNLITRSCDYFQRKDIQAERGVMQETMLEERRKQEERPTLSEHNEVIAEHNEGLPSNSQDLGSPHDTNGQSSVEFIQDVLAVQIVPSQPLNETNTP